MFKVAEATRFMAPQYFIMSGAGDNEGANAREAAQVLVFNKSIQLPVGLKAVKKHCGASRTQ